MTLQKKSNLIFALSILGAVLVYLKNGWVSDDAYILFRGIEQLFAGNGPNWNPHERVQTFTSPLWFWLLAFTRIFSSHLYINTILTSFLLWLGTLFILRKLFGNDYVLLASVLLFTASRGFYDYTSSGLENTLAYFFIALFLFLNNKLFSKNPQSNRKRTVIFNLIVYGLLICIRHDLAVLFFPIVLFSIWKSAHLFTLKQWIGLCVVSLSPFIIWTLFSLVYYGFPFPNTAYAKIDTGIDKLLIMQQGVKYLISSLLFDTITMTVIGAALFVCIKRGKADSVRFLGYGIVLNLIYIIYVGGDFMQGRFLSYAFMIAAIIIMQQIAANWNKKQQGFGVAVLLLYLFLYPNTPFATPLNYQNYRSKLMISDERGTYFKRTSLYARYIRYPYSVVFPPHKWSFQGLRFKMQNDHVRVFGNIGFFGYWAGADKIIIDPLGLADPLLARLPVQGEWRVGHYLRELPTGYVQSVETDKNMIENPSLHEYYDKIKLITQSDKLFTWQRIKTIVLFNAGTFDHLTEF
ncbi:MAG: hypothetical protein U5R06_21145 [candidate division KSB1 bacterium]|nr:hypothetical protein [candidate division KSB1 bacterium]